MSGKTLIFRAAIAGALWACALGCASDPDPEPPKPAPKKDVVRGAEQGLEVIWWPVDDSTGALARALAPYADRPVPISPTRQRALRANGLRIVAVPAADADAIRQSLRLVGPVQRQWFGQLPRWTPIISGPAWEGDRLIELDQPERSIETPPGDSDEPDAPEGLLRLGPGRLRLLARCWIDPSLAPGSEESAAAPEVVADQPDGAEAAARPAVGAMLQLEVVPQHEEREEDSALVRAAPGSQKAKGLLFTRLTLSARCNGDEVLLLVPETPGARWRPAEELSNDAPGLPALPPAFRGVERPPTLGEAMLTDAELGGFGRTKIVVVLVPRVPGEYTLLH